MYKKLKPIINIVVMMIITVIVASIVMTLLIMFNNTKAINTLQKISFFAPMLLLILSVISFISHFYFRYHIKKDNYSQEENSYFTTHEQVWSVISGYLCEICIILNITFMGLNYNSIFHEIYPTISIYNTYAFYIIVFLCFTIECLNSNLQKKMRPELNSDITSVNYNNDIFNKMDEMEKKQIGEAAYRSFVFLTNIYVFTILFALYLIIVFDIDTIIVLPVGFLWVSHMLTFYYNNYKLEKKKKHKNIGEII